MRKLFIFFLSLFFLASCNKKDSTGNGTTVVQYQVTAINSSSIAVQYNNVLGQKVSLNVQSGWVFDITVDQKPFQAYLQGISSSPTSTVQTSCTVNILVNGQVVKTNSAANNGNATAEAQYTVQ